ncbi:hypothetical protein [Burkholderia multivorans]|jgi:hypothetical protein|uniref:hypothetical protein n=1 Tax=Burkholderia multivorans TaxID=87883 RepID=UPI000B15F74D|nr:hypothetical protein [Burkholderia multivorans]
MSGVRVRACAPRSIVSGGRQSLRFGQSIEIVERSQSNQGASSHSRRQRASARFSTSTERAGQSHRLPTIALCSNPRSAGFAEIEKQRSDAESSAPIDFRATLR